LLGILAIGLGSRCAFALQVSERFDRGLQASYIAVGGVQHAVSVLARDLTPTVDGFNEEWTDNEAEFARRPLGEGTFSIQYPTLMEDGTVQWRYGMEDEERKLNLNTAPEDVLHRLIQEAGGVEAGPALVIAQSIVDWRDTDQDPRPVGAENFYYHGLSPSYSAKDGPFQSVEEVQLVRGMTPKVFKQLEPYVTVYGEGKVNINTAPVPVLRALGLSETGINGLAFYRSGEDNTEGTPDDRAIGAPSAIPGELFNVMPQEDIARLMQLAQQDVLTTQSTAFGCVITGEAGSRWDARVALVVTREGQVLSWSEQPEDLGT
jgi:hypothetical protein